MESSMQPQPMSEQDKMVPIDTSGESVDVELKDETKEENNKQENQDIKVEETKEDSFENKTEADEYSASVQKRIDKLTFKVREAERQKEEALKFAESVNKENANLKSKVTEVDNVYLDEYSKRVSSEMEKAQSILQDAINSGNAKKQVEAQQAIARLAIEEERANASKLQRERLLKEEKENPKPKEPIQNAQPDPKAEAWAEKNPWYGEDEAMTYTALSIHKKLLREEGFDGKSDLYYDELNKRIRKEFPHKFEDENKKDRPAQAVASANRSIKSGRRTVKLTPSQVAIAKKLGVSLEDYAKHVKEA